MLYKHISIKAKKLQKNVKSKWQNLTKNLGSQKSFKSKSLSQTIFCTFYTWYKLQHFH